jgi:Kef-type K+ transport system membrane component KefB
MKRKIFIFYALVTGLFSLLLSYILKEGALLQASKQSAVVQVQAGSSLDELKRTLLHSFEHPLSILLLQIISILVVAKIVGRIFNKIGQPTVIGEIVAGIILGPSILGMYFPAYLEFLFPANSMMPLQLISQIGLILFMFVIGMELDIKVLKSKAYDAFVISHSSIIVPFILGTGLAYFIYQEYAPDDINFMSFALFMGVAMSITAFPVLARIIKERNLTKTKVGSIALTCAAADDVTAWFMLAAVIAIVKAGSFVSALFTIGLTVIYFLVMLKVVRPLLIKYTPTNKKTFSKSLIAIYFIVLVFSACTTEIIGIHALFGAFIAGLIIPENLNLRSSFIEKLEDVSTILLLPLFFVCTGLRTQISLISGWHLWLLTGLIILVAVAGKFLGSTITSRYVGQSWKSSLMIGSLMNTRGLVELVVLNIGYELGVLSPLMFSMFVIMALFTTFMTGPTLDLINYLIPDKKAVLSSSDESVEFPVSLQSDYLEK